MRDRESDASKLSARQAQILEQFRAIARALGRVPTWAECDAQGLSRPTVRYHFGSRAKLLGWADLSGGVKDPDTPETVLARYAEIAESVGHRSPSIAECKAHKLTRDTIRHHYVTRADLDTQAREKYPEAFRDVPVDTIEAASPRSKTIIITSPVVGAPAHREFCQALRDMADRKKADLIALPVADPASRATPNGVGRLDRYMLDLGFDVVRGDLSLNENLAVLGIELSAKQIQPTTGLERFGQRGQSLIVPSPKRFLRFVPTLSKTPHAVMTPGACTIPNYDTGVHRSKRTAYLAAQDHALAGVIVEIEDDKRFHFRQLTWSDADGTVLDLGEDQHGNPHPFQAVQPGDWHSGEVDLRNREWVIHNPLGAEDIYLHDSFDGRSINHHTSFLEHMTDPLRLEDELSGWAADLTALSYVYRRVFIVESNHDERLRRWLDEGRHLKDRVNYAIGRALEQYDRPLEGWLGPRDGIYFLYADDSHKVGGVEMSQHGHRGANGGRRPSLASLEKSLGPCCVGHSHTPGIWREAWQAGTCTPLKLNYTAGPSSWLWSHIGIYPDGRRQMINLLPE